MAGIGLSAFSVSLVQSESFLSYQPSLEAGRETSDCRTRLGMAKIPTATPLRSMLDPVPPSHLHSSFDRGVATRPATIAVAGRVGKRFLEHMRPLTADLVIPDRRTLMTPLVTSKPPPEIANQIGG